MPVAGPHSLVYRPGMRLKSEIWVKAYVRRCNGEGAPAVVAHRGDAEAGIILVKVCRLDGTADLYGPAPSGYESEDGERRWMRIAAAIPESAADEKIAKELSLDRDTWVLEIEDRAGRSFLDTWLARDSDVI